MPSFMVYLTLAHCLALGAFFSALVLLCDFAIMRHGDGHITFVLNFFNFVMVQFELRDRNVTLLFNLNGFVEFIFVFA